MFHFCVEGEFNIRRQIRVLTNQEGVVITVSAASGQEQAQKQGPDTAGDNPLRIRPFKARLCI
ncbi:hypothetical protein GCM10022394_14680 [Zobellella aerophila]|uniref:Uncharacterized protein n=1 Tax=Zobellella aerophila TaxID=870480 RepID=A0ABP6VLP7_9GAMM